MKNLFQKWRGRSATALLLATTLAGQAADVKTLGGGPNQTGPARSGATDGGTFAFAKFRNPYSIAIDTNGNLLIADHGNNKIRKVTRPGSADSITSTFVSRLPSPSGVAVDASNQVYVVTQRDGRLRKFNGAGALLQTVSGFRNPTSVGVNADGLVFVSELSGNVYKVFSDGTIELIASGFRRPRGLAVLANGLLAVTESTGHAVQLLDPVTGISTLIAGGNGRGMVDGPGAEAKFNSPYSIAVAPNGSLVVADKLNHRVRVIDTNYAVTTLYGVLRNQWVRPFSGWADGTGGEGGVAASRDPVGVAVDGGGNVFVGEIYWDLLRKASATGLGLTNSIDDGTNQPPPGGGVNTNAFAAPTFAPTSGYFPFGVTITVTSSAPVFFTTDGTEPTKESRQAVMSGNVGTLRFPENMRDLTSLRLKAISAEGTSATVGGQAAANNEFGIPRDFVAGSGATILVPVVANLRTNARIQSFQYRVEITPLNGAPPILPYLRAASIDTNDFVPLATSAASGKTARYTTSRYSIGQTLGLVVTASGTNSFIDFEKFATTALLVVPIDPSAQDGDTYRIEVLYPSATSDGYGTPVPVTTGAPRTITVSAVPYLVGDASPSTGYNAGEFGDFDLHNNDANAVLFASVGLRVPFEFTDVFNGMDAFPPEPSAFGGDGRIEFADWQVVLNRSLRLDLQNWTRSWFGGGLQSDPVPLTAAAPRRSFAKSSSPKSAGGWSRGATLLAGNTYNNPSGHCEVPVSIKVAPGTSVAGLAFRVVIESAAGAPSVTDLSFQPLLGNSGFLSAAGAARNDIVCAWTMVPSSSFSPVLQGHQLLGNVTFSIPPNAVPGHHYTVRLIRSSGAADLDTAVSFEGIPGSAWVLWTPSEPGQKTSDEWRVHFFGSSDVSEAADNADPDGDGVPNWQEYLNGTNPNETI